MKRTYLMRKPVDDDDDFCSPQPTSSRLGGGIDGMQSREFVSASEGSNRSFQGAQQVIQHSKSMSSDERNKLAAKILKAELAGKKAMQLQKLLDENISVREAVEEDTSKVVLLKSDSRSGAIMPANAKVQHSVKVGRNTVENIFGEIASLDELVSMEKRTTAEDQIGLFGQAAKMTTGNKVDDDFTVDDSIMTHPKKRRHAEKDVKRSQKTMISEHKRLENTLDSCELCLGSPHLNKLSLVAVGFKTYLAVNPCKGFEGSVRIIPSEHFTSSIVCDEDVYEEIRHWKKSLVKMFAADEEDCIFFEIARRVKSQDHMSIECIPLDREMGDLAPIYFKQALENAGEQWGTHKKIFDLSKAKDGTVRSVIPKGFPYFAVDFGLQSGYAHVIENEDSFPLNFAQEIIGGMLDADHKIWRNVPVESTSSLKDKRDTFKKRWMPYDWTDEFKRD